MSRHHDAPVGSGPVCTYCGRDVAIHLALVGSDPDRRNRTEAVPTARRTANIRRGVRAVEKGGANRAQDGLFNSPNLPNSL
jgi:hypothetical protein